MTNTQKLTGLALTGLAALGLAAAHPAQAQTVTNVPLTNPHFTAGSTGPSDTNIEVNSIPGWSGPKPFNQYEYGEQYGPAFGRFPGGTPDGDGYYAFVYEGTYIAQDTGFATTIGDTYTLTGYIGAVDPSNAGSLSLFSGNTPLATTGSQTSASNTFTKYTTSFVATSSTTDLSIRLTKTDPITGADAAATLSPGNAQGVFDDISLTETAPSALPMTGYNDDDPAITYSAGWHFDNNRFAETGGAVDSGNSITYTSTDNATATFTFTGVQVSLYGETFSDESSASTVSIDGGPATTISEFSPTRVGDVLVYTSGLLSSGPHTLVFTDHPSSPSTPFANVDEFRVLAALPAPEPSQTAALGLGMLGLGGLALKARKRTA